MNTEKEFRKWARRCNYRLDSDDDGYYISTHTQSAWDAWREAEELWKTFLNFTTHTQEELQKGKPTKLGVS